MRKRTKRMLSVLMATLMVVSIMPVTGSNNIVVKASTASAESSVVTWSAADILAAQEGDSGLVLCGSGWVNNNATDIKIITRLYVRVSLLLFLFLEDKI